MAGTADEHSPASAGGSQDDRPVGIDAARGLATLAMLKVRFDEGRDHLALFEPFVTDAVARVEQDDFDTAQIATAIRSRHGVSLPRDTIQTILQRMVRSKILRRDGGRYFRNLPLEPLSFGDQRGEEEASQRALAHALFTFSATTRHPFASEEAALYALIDFVGAYSVPLSLSSDTSAWVQAQLLNASTEHRLVAAFVTTYCATDPALATALERLLQGYVLQNVLTLKDVTRPDRKFRKLIILLDAPIAFCLLGVMGEAAATATREGIELLRQAGGVPQVLDKTIGEMRRILAVYETKLATPSSQMDLHQTELTRYFLTAHWTPSDVRTLSATLDVALGQHGVSVRPIPERDPRYTEDEMGLSSYLSSDGKPSNLPRVVHDIDLVAAVLTLRQGETSASIEDCRAVCVTNSGRVIQGIQRWFRDSGGSGIPPVIHQVALTNVLWLKSPVLAAKLKLHELIALARAVAVPRGRTWAAFTRELSRLCTTKAITTDEAVAVMASSLVDPSLTALDDDLDPDLSTVADVIERVRASYRAEAEKTIEEVRADAEAKLVQAGLTAGAEAARRQQMQDRAFQNAVRISAIVKWGVVGVLSVLLIASVVLSLGLLPLALPRYVRALATIVTVASVLFGAYTVLTGSSIKQVGRTIESTTRRMVYPLLTGEPLSNDGTPGSPD